MDDVASLEVHSPNDELLIDVGAVSRAEVLDGEITVVVRNACVARRKIGVGETEVAVGAATNGHGNVDVDALTRSVEWFDEFEGEPLQPLDKTYVRRNGLGAKQVSAQGSLFDE